ncbi:MAG: DUF1178 family protein [Rhizobiaceae bacterium]|nr:DUF1178 family protein [Rhizobiaceae bacterium]
MITFALRCEPEGHGFDGWFRSTEDYEAQAGKGLVACPTCGSVCVAKRLMRPAVSSSRGGAIAPEEAARAVAAMQAMAREVRGNADYVGPNFAEEARRIHYGEASPRRIYGEASLPEVKGLTEEGIGVLPLPSLPEDKN